MAGRRSPTMSWPAPGSVWALFSIEARFPQDGEPRLAHDPLLAPSQGQGGQGGSKEDWILAPHKAQHPVGCSLNSLM